MLVTSSAPIALSSGLIKFGFGRAAAPSQTDKSASGFPIGTLTPSRPPPALVPVWELAQRGGGGERGKGVVPVHRPVNHRAPRVRRRRARRVLRRLRAARLRGGSDGSRLFGWGGSEEEEEK